MKPYLKETTKANHALNVGGKLLEWERPQVMGIINLTPDSFYSASRMNTTDAILEQAETMLTQGAFCLDLGAYSSRPGADDVTEEEELRRLIPAVENISLRFPEAILSVDTFRGRVAREAIAAGAGIINDISAGDDPELLKAAGENACPYITMHKKGTPKNMQQNPEYQDVVTEVMDFFSQRMPLYRQAGIKDVIIDPGFGFGKTQEHNFSLLKSLEAFHIFECPILAGLSRKSMITRTLQVPATEALNGTTALHMLALNNGTSFLRAHDVKEAVECVRLFCFYMEAP